MRRPRKPRPKMVSGPPARSAIAKVPPAAAVAVAVVAAAAAAAAAQTFLHHQLA